jgi:putative Ca2+/H+ antiporter (TMEM165/GDT1 family)
MLGKSNPRYSTRRQNIPNRSHHGSSTSSYNSIRRSILKFDCNEYSISWTWESDSRVNTEGEPFVLFFFFLFDMESDLSHWMNLGNYHHHHHHHPQVLTHYAAALLFLVFGIRMLQEGLKIPAGQAHIQEEMREVEDELELDDQARGMDSRGLTALEAMEEGNGEGQSVDHHLSEDSLKVKSRTGVSISPNRRSQSFHPLSAPSVLSPTSTSSPMVHYATSKLRSLRNSTYSGKEISNGARNFCSLFVSPVFAQAFVLTFLGEWGDRSQIATIALAGANVSV